MARVRYLISATHEQISKKFSMCFVIGKAFVFKDRKCFVTNNVGSFDKSFLSTIFRGAGT